MNRFDELTLTDVLIWLYNDTASDRWETYDDGPSEAFLLDWWWNDLTADDRLAALDYFEANY